MRSVAKVFTCGCPSQIFYPIVRLYSVNMINVRLSFWIGDVCKGN